VDLRGECFAYGLHINDRRSREQGYARLVGDIVGLARLKRPSGAYEVMDLDGDFTEDYGAIIPVVTFVLKEVFGDFFSAALGSGSRVVAGRA